MKIRSVLLLLALSLAAVAAAAAEPVKLQAENAKLDSARVEVLSTPKIANDKVVALKSGVAANVHTKDTAPDLVFDLKLPAGRYEMKTFAVTDAEGEALMSKAKTKFESIFMQVQLDDQIPGKKVIYVPWNRPLQTTGKYQLKPGSQLKIWLPRGVQLDRVEFEPYVPPAVPAAAKNYQPKITPKAERPRLWVNPETLPQVRANLNLGENKAVWEEIQASAAKPYAYTYDPEADIQYDAKLERAAQEKAFVYLMTGDKKIGREAVDLMMAYIPNVQFNNLLDIAREIGRALVSCSFVYDYCYDLMTPAERTALSSGMMRLADDMECGWPPFGQPIVNGHGAEAQINRDLLTMAIAIYGENNESYKYCSYLILEELMPMRAFEYRSNRHNQGVGYGSFRFNFEMHAAWLMRRMAGREVFDPNIKTVYNQWLYGRLPDGSIMLDGDGSLSKGYFKRPQNTFMCASYAADPLFKAEFEKQGGKADDALIFLMLNDPALKADGDLTKLPQVHYFRDVLPAIIFRTGWNIGPDSSDVFIEMKGGGYSFANHQHLDAGAFQIFYRGILATDLGTYKFSGTPYDFGFNKRSIPHNVMLIHDPGEKFGRGNVSNDGGQRVVERTPLNVKMLTTDPEFITGKTLSADFGPDAMAPEYVFFKTNLAPAYSAKVKFYTRSFAVLRTGNEAVPALLFTVDRVESAQKEFKKYYTLNTLFEPKKNGEALEVTSDWKTNPGKLTFRMLLPAKPEIKILQGKETWNVFGTQLTAPLPDMPQAKGYRTMVSPAAAATDDLFVAAMAIGNAAAIAPEIKSQAAADHIELNVLDFTVVLGTGKAPIAKPFKFTVAAGKESRVLLADLAPGKWKVTGSGKDLTVTVEPGKNTAYAKLGGGDYQVAPVR